MDAMPASRACVEQNSNVGKGRTKKALTGFYARWWLPPSVLIFAELARAHVLSQYWPSDLANNKPVLNRADRLLSSASVYGLLAYQSSSLPQYFLKRRRTRYSNLRTGFFREFAALGCSSYLCKLQMGYWMPSWKHFFSVMRRQTPTSGPWLPY